MTVGQKTAERPGRPVAGKSTGRGVAARLKVAVSAARAGASQQSTGGNAAVRGFEAAEQTVGPQGPAVCTQTGVAGFAVEAELAAVDTGTQEGNKSVSLVMNKKRG